MPSATFETIVPAHDDGIETTDAVTNAPEDERAL
jgi:hypothetical protein